MEAEDDAVVRGDTLTVYSSFPRHGTSAAAGEAALAGAQRALRAAGGRAGGRRIRLVGLAATRPGDRRWDPGTVKANAERARDDPSAIAYLGELDLGGSAVSLPVTNGADLLQVSPTDGLTSLTRTPPGRPRAGPERYYPRGMRTFARLVPSDLVVAERLAALLGRRGGPVAMLVGEGFADRELAAVLLNRLRGKGAGPALVETLRDDVDAVPGLVEDLVAARARTVAVISERAPVAAATLAALGRRRPDVRVLGTSGALESAAVAAARPREVLGVTQLLPTRAQPPAGRRLVADIARERGRPERPEALYGFEAMRLVLRAIGEAGPDRRAVIRAATTTARRRTALGPVALDGAGDARPRRVALIRLRGRRVVLDRVSP